MRGLGLLIGAALGAFVVSALLYAGLLPVGGARAPQLQYGSCEAVVAVLDNGSALVVAGWYLTPQAVEAGQFFNPVFAAVNQTAVRSGATYAVFSEKFYSLVLYAPGAGSFEPMLSAAYAINGTWPPNGTGYPMLLFSYYPPYNNATVEGLYVELRPGSGRFRLNATYGGLLLATPAASPGSTMQVPCSIEVVGPLPRSAALSLPLPPAAVWYYEALGYYKYGLNETYLEETAWRIPLGWPVASTK